MGIEDFNKFVSTNAPNAITSIPLAAFRGTRIAIDACGLMYNKMQPSYKYLYTRIDLKKDPTATIDETEVTKVWMGKLLDFCVTIISYGITPVFVFDGPNKEGKERIQDKRKKVNEKEKKNIEDLEAELSALLPHERKDEDIAKLRSRKQNRIRITGNQTNLLKNVLRLLRIPIITAWGDGEELCCTLAIIGKVSAVYSRDADCSILGSPISILEIDKESPPSEQRFKCVIYDRLLEGLSIEMEQLVDIAILYGCDYSVGVRGYGLLTAWKKIRQFGSIEAIPNINLGDINLDESRSKLRAKSVNKSVDESHEGVLPSLNLDHSAFENSSLRPFMESYGLSGYIMQLKAAYRNVTVFQDRGAEYILEEGRIIRRGPIKILVKRPETVIIPESIDEFKDVNDDDFLEVMGVKSLSFA